MSHLLEILGRGLLAELSASFSDVLFDAAESSTEQLLARVRQQPTLIDNHIKLGIRMLATGKCRQARDAFQLAFELDADHEKARLGLACALSEQGQTQEAIRVLRETLADYPKNECAWFALGFCLERSGEATLASQAYDRVIEISPSLRNAHERLAAIHLMEDRLSIAIEHYEVICAGAPDDAQAALLLANLFVRANRFDEAIKRYQYALSLEPGNWEACDDHIDACLKAGRYEEAIDALCAMVEQRPECAELHVRLGDAYRVIGRNADAAQAFQRALNVNPELLEAVVKVGTGYLRQGAFEDAALMFGQATELNDRTLSAYVGMGVAQQALGLHEEAAASFETAAAVEPNSTMLFSEVARLQLVTSAAEQRKRYLSPRAVCDTPEAPRDQDIEEMIKDQIAQLQESARRHTNHADVHYRLGLLQRHIGDLDGAIDSYRRAVIINPHYAAALGKLGVALHERGSLNEAEVVFQRALQVDPSAIRLHYELGLVFADRGEFTLALERFEHATEADPGKADHVANLALCLQDMGLLDRASTVWDLLGTLGKEAQSGRIMPDSPDASIRPAR